MFKLLFFSCYNSAASRGMVYPPDSYRYNHWCLTQCVYLLLVSFSASQLCFDKHGHFMIYFFNVTQIVNNDTISVS